MHPGAGFGVTTIGTGGPTTARFVVECRSCTRNPAFPSAIRKILEVCVISGRKRGIAGRRKGAEGGAPGIESFREITTV